MAITIDLTAALNTVTAASSVAGSLVTLVQRATTVENASATSWPVTVKLLGTNGTTPTIRINTTQAFFDGYVMAAAERLYFSYDLITWFTFGQASSAGSGYYDYTHTAAFTGDVWISRDRRVGVTAIDAWITSLSGLYGSMIQFPAGLGSYVTNTLSAQTNELGGNCPSLTQKGFLVSDSSLPGVKQVGCFLSGVHAGEDIGNSNMMAAVNYWCGATAEAIALRRRFNLFVGPAMNIMGREYGHCRAQFELGAGNINDMNRHMSDVSSPFETVGLNRTFLLTQMSASYTPFALDFHGLYSISSGALFGYGNGPGIAPFNDPFMVYYNTRAGAGVIGDLVVSDTIYVDAWCAHNLNAQLAETLEFNFADYAFKTDAAIADHGEDIVLSLYDLLAAGYFGPTATTATPFGRRAA